jgi:hypothetical protein
MYEETKDDADKSKTEDLTKLHAESLRQFDIVQEAMREERKQCLEDRRFYSIAGAQWEGALGEQFENKSRFEDNKVLLAVMRIINEYRNNRITVTFKSKTGETGPEYDKLAEACAELFRADEQDSVAEEAYDNAFEETAGGGFGAARLCTEYEEDEEYEDGMGEDGEERKQRIRIKPIVDADSCVFFDLNAKRQDKSDAQHCWVLIGYERNTYKEKFGDDPASWPKDITATHFDWATPDLVYVAEYYCVVKEPQKIEVWRNRISDEVEQYPADDVDDELRTRLEATGWVMEKERTKMRRRVRKLLLSGGGALEDMGYIAGPNIPVVPNYGRRWFVDGIERCMGAVRTAKDMQRLLNMMISKLAEIAAASSYDKPVLTPEQIAGHQPVWENENVHNYRYLPINDKTDASGNIIPSGTLEYVRAPNIPPTLAALIQITSTDLREILGSAQQGEQMVSNIASKTVEMIQERLDMQSYIYMSNFAKFTKRMGEVWLGMASEVYVEPGRKMKGINAAGDSEQIELMRPSVSKDGESVMENDLSEARLDVVADVGPSSSTKRQSTVRTLKELMAINQDQETATVLSSMIMMNMEGEGISEVRDFFRARLIRMGAVKPTEEEAKTLADEMAGKPEDPNSIYLKAAAEEASAAATKARADTLLTLTKTDQARADILKTLSEIDQTEKDNALRAIELLLGASPSTSTPFVQAPEVQQAGQTAPGQPVQTGTEAAPAPGTAQPCALPGQQ